MIEPPPPKGWSPDTTRTSGSADTPMGLRFYNTLTRSLEPFEPLVPDEVRMYTCGPTVYDRAHIGNFRTFVWEDLLRRTLEWKGLSVTQVMNLTDVDDRTIEAALARGCSLLDVTEPVIEWFREDWETLGLERVEREPRATEHVPRMIELVRRLEERGLTYESEGSVYFAIGRFPEYGRLANLDPESLADVGRAAGDEEYAKDDPRDFVLWKGGDREREGRVATWDSPWGPGRPGWHLECSAMAMEYLGETFDIHTGGVDNIFPHHTNEIAQAQGATGKPFARYWLHAAHLLVDGGKMAKSLGNAYTIPDLLERGHAPSAVRYLLLSGHYRSPLNFTFEALEDADRAVERLHEFRRRSARAREREPASAGSAGREGDGEGESLAAGARRARDRFGAALDDDLNVSEALAAVFDFVRQANQALDEAAPAAPRGLEEALALLDDFDRVFGVLTLREREATAVPSDVVAWLEERIEARHEARRARDFERADRIRDEVEERGFVLEDSPAGTRWKRRGAPGASTASSRP